MQHPLWHNIPLVRLLIPFACGIGFSLFVEIPFVFILTCFVFFFAGSVWIHYTLQQYTFRWVYGVCISICLFAGGWALNIYQNELKSVKHYGLQKDVEYVKVTVHEEPSEKPSGYKVAGTALGVVDHKGSYKMAIGKLSVFIAKKEDAVIPVYGDVILVPFKKIIPVKGPQNPDEFDFKRYLSFKQIYFQAYLNAEDFVITGENQSRMLMRWVYRVQHYFKDVLARYIGSANESAVAEALLYGYDDDIDNETMQAYANTGTLHVLAVSGMHVGIIYMILGMMLAPLGKLKKGKIIRQLVILLLLWVYSFICGMSPSILRATVMFSFIIIGDMLDEHSNIYNTLAASAFVLLCYDTNMIANVGFQLSYLAVLGIVFFQPFIAILYTAPNWFMHQVWSVTAVSLAAQLITFPIGLYYFHQFPNCFLLSNLIIIPLTTLILYGGMVLLVVSQFSWIGWLLGQCLFYLIRFTNDLVKWIEDIPYAYVNGIRVSIAQSVILYMIIILLTLYFIRRSKILLKGALCCAVIYAVLHSYHTIMNLKQQKMFVYHTSRYNTIQWILGKDALLLGDSAFVSNHTKMKFHLQQHLWNRGVEQQQISYMDSLHWQKISIAGHTILVSGRNGCPDRLVCDLLIIKNKMELEEVFQYITPNEVIVTAAVKPADAAVMLGYCRNKNIAAQFVGEKGAIELSLSR